VGPENRGGSRYTGKERDSETGLDFSKARYYASNMGRFMSTDPLGFTPLHLINPQRWNQYAYAVDNPLTYVDPDGKDAIVAEFSNMAAGLGHLAAISVENNGVATYGDFGPTGGGKPLYSGDVNFTQLNTKIEFDSNYMPTRQSLDTLKSELAAKENQPVSSITLRYYSTLGSEAIAMKQAMMNAFLSRNGWKMYLVGINDCRRFTKNALAAAGINFSYGRFETPNAMAQEEAWDSWLDDYYSSQDSGGSDDSGDPKTHEEVTHRVLDSNGNPI
jgi:RHS repeat-associated protein